MKARTPSDSPSRPRPATLAEVARLARVSLMTASYAMRNNPKISEPTRRRVQIAAKKLGYVPNPEIARLMHLLRARRLPAYQSTLGFLSFSHDAHPALHRYTVDVIAGAKARAARLGYAVNVLNIDSRKLTQTRLTTMLMSRGIRGVLIPPLPIVEDCSNLLDWSRFSIVAATYSAQNLIVNRVVPHHQGNIMLAITELQKLGNQRLGLVLPADLTSRANFAYEAAFALHQQTGRLPPIPVLRLDLADPDLARRVIGKWLRAYAPEMILTAGNALPLLDPASGQSVAHRYGICLLDHSGVGPLVGIHQLPAIIGETAVDLLAGQVQRGELGFQQHARLTMVEGAWHPGDA